MVLKIEGSAEILERLARANLFVIPLDQERGWYRYHHLFRDLLEMRSSVDTSLHARASEWFESEGLMDAAIIAAHQAGDTLRCAELIEVDALDEIALGRLKTVIRRLEYLPDDVVLDRPVLCVVAAWVKALTGHGQQAIPFILAVTSTPPSHSAD